MAGLRGPTRALALAGLVALGTAAQVSAQESGNSQSWHLQNIRARWCVYFLMDSTTADKKLPNGYRPRHADDFPGLSPAISRLIHDDSTYAGWIPAQFCTTHFDRALVDNRPVGDSAEALSSAQTLVTWLIGVTPPAGNSSGASYFIATLRSDNWRLLRQGEVWSIRGERAERTVGKVPESTEDMYQVKLGRTILTWEGHLAGDSASKAAPVEESWFTQSSRNGRIQARAMFQPDSLQSVAGTLRITGKDDLAKSLRASPIRMVGPMMWGGEGSIEFTK